MGLPERLAELEVAGTPIRLGLVGVGQMGAGLIGQTGMTLGMKVVAAADIVLDRAISGLQEAGDAGEIVTVTSEEVASGQADRLIAGGQRVATRDAMAVCKLANVDVVIEATGVPSIGASIAFSAILARKHVVMLNVETDATVGYLLKRMADMAGVIYTTSAGDEPGAIKELYDFAIAMGFEVVCVGKGKNNPLDHSANPSTVAEQATTQEMAPKMLASFVDGSKTMVEMTSVANALSFHIDQRGMHGPRTTVDKLAEVFVPKEDGGILNGRQRVDYATGPVAPGVFVIITTEQPKVVKDLKYLKLGKGPYWSLYRPYHLANMETTLSAARAVIYGEATLAPKGPPTAETLAIAKRDLQPGEVLDGIGGYTVYAGIDNAETAREEGLLPLGLIEGARMKVAVRAGTPLKYEDVELDERSVIVHLRRLQDALVYGNGMTVPIATGAQRQQTAEVGERR